ncbi:MAG TPA: hypothetical protein VJU87_04410 [Gemmatimonadaceae bacterium]|nr:hypothetical protein [Gemmatimonadaceae bacterium]
MTDSDAEARAALAARRASGTTEFSDAAAMRWTVWEIAYAGLSEHLLSLFPHPERRGGWLLFESASERRRLSPYPNDWRELPDAQLAELCAQAAPVGKGEARRRDDAAESR